MPRFSDKELNIARNVNIIDYLTYKGYELKKVGSNYKLPNMGGFFIKENGRAWNCFCENVSGGVIKLVMHLDNKPWREAVQTLIEFNDGIDLSQKNENYCNNKIISQKNEKKEEFLLPKKNKTYKHIIGYLIKTRKIDKDIVYSYINKGDLYENEKKSCVFVAKDEKGKAKFAQFVSTNTHANKIRGNIKGSDKNFVFSYVNNMSDSVMVFESPIDLMSYQTLMKIRGDNLKLNMISLGGVSSKGLDCYLKRNAHIKNIIFALDNDKAGYNATKKMIDMYFGKYELDCKVPISKDWNDDLKKLFEEEKQISSYQEITDDDWQMQM